MNLAIAQQKGGTGKTTTTINVGGALAELGDDVLLVDADPQGYLTMGVGLDNQYTDASPTLADALRSPDDHSLAKLTHTTHSEFDVVPAAMDMFTIEQDLVSAMRGRERMEMLLSDHTDHDWVLIDCPPSLGLLTDNALLAAGNVLVPAEAQDTSIRALELLLKQITTLEERFDTHITERGIVISNVTYPLDTEQKDMLQWFDDRFGDRIPVHEVRNRVAIKRAFNQGQSISGTDEDCDQEESLLRIAADLQSQEEVA